MIGDFEIQSWFRRNASAPNKVLDGNLNIGQTAKPYPFLTLVEIMKEEPTNYLSCSHWGLFKHDYSLDFH